MAVSPTSTVQDAGLVSRAQPQAAPDGANLPVRQDRYGSVVPWYDAPTRHALSEEGSYLLATNPTVGTGMLWPAAQVSYLNTAPSFYVSNTDAGRSIYLDYLKLIATAVATGTTAIHFAMVLDTLARGITTNNMAAIVPVNPNGQVGNIGSPTILAQNSATASVMAAPSANARLVSRGVCGGLNIVGTEVLLTFGSTDAGCYPGSADVAGNPGRRGASTAPIIVGPGQSLTCYFWLPGSSASPAPEFEFGMWLR